MRTVPLEELVERFRAGDVLALSRLITMLEKGQSREQLFCELGHSEAARLVGITGPPGAGKSTIVDRLAVARAADKVRTAVLAADPSSPFTGGALLGDRFRMSAASRAGVYIRSMATRGSLGGLPDTTTFAAELLSLFGFETVFLETVGVGQAELEIVMLADTVVVVLVPESGDAVQAMKAGLMEAADIFVVNKADREGAELFGLELEETLRLGVREREWEPPVLLTSARNGTGLEELQVKIDEHSVWAEKKGRRKEKLLSRRVWEVENLIAKRTREELGRGVDLRAEVERGLSSGESVFSIADRLYARLAPLALSRPEES